MEKGRRRGGIEPEAGADDDGADEEYDPHDGVLGGGMRGDVVFYGNSKDDGDPAPPETVTEETQAIIDLPPPPTPRPTTSTPGGASSLTPDRIRATRTECNSIINLLEEYYFGKDQAYEMLVKSFIDPWDFNDDASEEEGGDGDDDVDDDPSFGKYHRANKLVDTMARALADDDRKRFVIGGMGSSVMAGHDNCRYDNYGNQMKRLWGPAWEAAGMEFDFLNAGIGGGCGDSHANQHFCVGQLFPPDDVDIVHYEWTYFEHGGAEVVHEDLIRWSQLLGRRPPVHIFNTGTMNNAPMHVGSDTVRYPPDGELTMHYARQGFNAFYLKTAFVNGGHDYEAEKNREEDPFDRFSPGFVGDGYHNTTRYGETEEDFARKNSLGVVMRNWVRKFSDAQVS